MLGFVLSHHPDAEITFLSHLSPEESRRDPVDLNDGKHQILFPSFPTHAYHCFHPKLILIRFPDRLRVVISSSNLMEEDWTEWAQCVWMQVPPCAAAHP